MRLREVLCAAVTGAALAATVAGAGEPARLYVTVDKAEVVNFPSAPFTKIAVTNPTISAEMRSITINVTIRATPCSSHNERREHGCEPVMCGLTGTRRRKPGCEG